MKSLQPTELGHNLVQPHHQPCLPVPFALRTLIPKPNNNTGRIVGQAGSTPIHLGCLMHFVTRHASPTCPACRQPWSPQAGQHLDQGRAAAHLEWPVPETPADTHAPRDHPPNPPTNIIPLCCPRLALINPSHPELDASWRELPTRHMEWAPTMDQTTRQWQAEWICLRCNRQVTTEHPSMQHTGPTPHCNIHGPRQLAVDHSSNERGWVCSIRATPHTFTAANPRCSKNKDTRSQSDRNQPMAHGLDKDHQTPTKIYQPRTHGSTCLSFSPEHDGCTQMPNTNGDNMTKQATNGSTSYSNFGKPPLFHGNKFTTPSPHSSISMHQEIDQFHPKSKPSPNALPQLVRKHPMAPTSTWVGLSPKSFLHRDTFQQQHRRHSSKRIWDRNLLPKRPPSQHDGDNRIQHGPFHHHMPDHSTTPTARQIP